MSVDEICTNLLQCYGWHVSARTGTQSGARARPRQDKFTVSAESTTRWSSGALAPSSEHAGECALQEVQVRRQHHESHRASMGAVCPIECQWEGSPLGLE